jgi:hypothetical protein
MHTYHKNIWIWHCKIESGVELLMKCIISCLGQELTSENDTLSLCSSIWEILRHELISHSSEENHTSTSAWSLQTYRTDRNSYSVVLFMWFNTGCSLWVNWDTKHSTSVNGYMFINLSLPDQVNVGRSCIWGKMTGNPSQGVKTA